MKEFYNIEEVAVMTMLSTRTIRNYIKQGFLDGEKIEGVWQFTAEDIEAFFKNDYVRQSIQTKKNAMVYDYMIDNTKAKASVCSIYDYPVADGKEAEAIYKKLEERINSNEYGSLKFSYEYHKKMVRIILVGDPVEMARLME